MDVLECLHGPPDLSEDGPVVIVPLPHPVHGAARVFLVRRELSEERGVDDVVLRTSLSARRRRFADSWLQACLHLASEVGDVGHSRTTIDGGAIARRSGSEGWIVEDFEVVDEGHAVVVGHGEMMLEDFVDAMGADL